MKLKIGDIIQFKKEDLWLSEDVLDLFYDDEPLVFGMVDYVRESLFLIAGIKKKTYDYDEIDCYILKPLDNDRYNDNPNKLLLWRDDICVGNETNFMKVWNIVKVS